MANPQPKTRIIRFNKKTHKPEYIGIQEPLENGDAILTTIYGNINTITIPVPDTCDECKLFKEGICNHTHENNCKIGSFPVPEEEEEEK